MKTFSETTILLLALAIASCLGVVVAVEPKEFPTYEHLTFLNFHREPIDVYSFDKESNTQELLLSVPPYEETTIQTYSGSHYSYKWGKEQYLSTTVKETSFLRVNESDYDRDLKSQVHVMGLVNIPDGPMIQLVTGNKLRRKPQRVYVKCGTTKGDFNVIVNPEWSPRGAAHYLKLVKDGHFTNMAIHNRTEAGIEYGISADYNRRSDFPEYILDDPMFVPPILHKPGTMSFSADTENGRSDMIFTIMQGEYCDSMVHGLRNNTWETPFAYVDSRDLKVLQQITWWLDYEGGPDRPDEEKIREKDGYQYLEENFPDMDYINGCALVPREIFDIVDTRKMSYETLAALNKKFYFNEEEFSSYVYRNRKVMYGPDAVAFIEDPSNDNDEFSDEELEAETTPQSDDL